MDMIGFLICFTVTLMEFFSRGDPNPVIFAGGMIGMGLCAIAGALNNMRRK